MFPPIFAHLTASPAVLALVGSNPSRIYSHGEAPAAPVAPYVVWQVVGGDPQNTLDEAPTVDFVQLQLDVYAATGPAVQQLFLAVRAALEPHCLMSGLIADERGATEPRLYRVALQFDYWLDR